MPLKIDVKEYIRTELEQSKPGGALLTRILANGQKQGFHRKDLWPELISRFGEKDIQKSWSDWASLNDREEIRLRLKVLNETDTLDESLVDFILFFFRASDPVLYQLSSIVMGRELDHYPRLKSYFLDYCRKRDIPADAPVRLNNQRSRRRVLLVRASWLVGGSGGRVFLFLGVTFIYTGMMVCLFWYMFSSTDQVVHGKYAPLHLLSWTGFALFVGVFLGLIGREE
jgi:hypothetical protein